MTRQARANAIRQRGMSLVELMVGVTIGLFIVAAAVTLVAGQLSDNRRLTVELQVQQDLRATSDIITRQLRRAGFAGVEGAQASVATPDVDPALNALADITTAGPDFDEVGFAYYYNAGDNGPYGYRLVNGVIQAQMGGNWQELTDPRTVRITGFTITPTAGLQSRLPCPEACADGTSNCWPELVVRELVIWIRGEAVGNAQLMREINSRVRLRNDWVRFNAPDPAGGPNNLLCPPG
jgi:prepilin-type N-terminal cleavage/methylation domain-containing protein